MTSIFNIKHPSARNKTRSTSTRISGIIIGIGSLDVGIGNVNSIRIFLLKMQLAVILPIIVQIPKVNFKE